MVAAEHGRRATSIAVVLGALLGCHPGPRPTDPLPPPPAADVAESLERAGYYRLFDMPDSRRRRDALWNEPGAAARLVRVMADPAAPWLRRFLAAEVIFQEQMFFILHRPDLFASLAGVYARALTENATGSMSDWGFRASMDDPGLVGIRISVFKLDADAALRPLLEDDKPVTYTYPADEPFSIRPGFRVKDFAALHLAQAHGIALHLTEDAAQRDVEIARLRSLLTPPPNPP